MRRLVIYFFFDENGIVDNYVTYMLSAIREHTKTLIVVCNGKLNNAGSEVLNSLCDELIIRENIGFDVWAYKAAIGRIGWNVIRQYDEIIMMNHTIIGPLFPFSEMFEKMDLRDNDFWGITTHGKAPIGFLKEVCPNELFIPEHIQSHFIAVRKRLLESPEFENYWTSMPMINDYNEAVGLHEAFFTRTFAELGYSWGAYTNPDELADISYYPLMDFPSALVKKHRCPIVKRRTFDGRDFDAYGQSTLNDIPRRLFHDIESVSEYPVALIWETVLRRNELSNLCRKYGPTLLSHRDSRIHKKTASKLLLVTIDQENPAALLSKQTFESVWDDSPDILRLGLLCEQDLDFKQILLDIHAFCRKCATPIDCIVFISFYAPESDYFDRKNPSVYKRLVQDIACLAKTPESLEKVQALFDKNPHLGMLVPPLPISHDARATEQRIWQASVSELKRLAAEFALSFDSNRHYPWPLGGTFALRATLLQDCLECLDGCTLARYDLSLPLILQSQGYFTDVILDADISLSRFVSNDALDEETGRLRRALRAREQTIDELTNSTSWKITKPLRLLGSGLKRR
jgi:rhamnosyltransferase